MAPSKVFSISLLFVAVICVSSAFSINQNGPEDEVYYEETFEDSTGPQITSTTTEPPPDEDDLTTTDKIIIGVTCGLTGSVLIGAIVYGCSQKQKAKKERNAMYSSYLNRPAIGETVTLGATSSAVAGGGADNYAFNSSERL